LISVAGTALLPVTVIVPARGLVGARRIRRADIGRGGHVHKHIGVAEAGQLPTWIERQTLGP
jgi:hypothetical protein